MTTRVNKLHQNSKFEQLIKYILFGQTSVISHHNSILDVEIFKLCKNRLMPLMHFLKENVITTLIPLRPEERNSEKSNKNNKTDTRKDLGDFVVVDVVVVSVPRADSCDLSLVGPTMILKRRCI